MGKNVESTLIEMGNRLYESESGYAVPLGADADAEKLVRDLKNYPHAFVLACLMDRGVKEDRAWLIPKRIRDYLGSFEFRVLSEQSLEYYHEAFATLHLHRYIKTMPTVFYRAIQKIKDDYGSDASRLWSDAPGSHQLVKRFREFHGCGQKISTMAANILARDFKVALSDHSGIDVSADVHVLRVFVRTGLVPSVGNDAQQIKQTIAKARQIHPEFPGIVDIPSWRIGREWCRPTNPNCTQCEIGDVCPKII